MNDCYVALLDWIDAHLLPDVIDLNKLHLRFYLIRIRYIHEALDGGQLN